MTPAIPRTVDDLTPEWCSEALSFEVTEAEATPLGVGVGLVGELFKLAVCGPEGDRVVVAKLAAPSDETRFVATVLNMYGREVGFYNELSARTPIGHPECYFAAHDPESQDTVLLLEDVSTRGRALDQVAGCSVDEARPAIRTLARLHAAYWDDATLDDLDWLGYLADDRYTGAVAFAYEAAWPKVQELFAEDMTPSVRAFGDAYVERIPALFAKLSQPPVVLAHADWRLDNLFFTPDGEVVAVDWQLIDRSVGPRDLAYLATQSLEVEDPADYRQAFDWYMADLATHGVTPDVDWAWEMYGYATSFGFVYPVVAAGGLAIEDPRHVDLTRQLLVRSVRAIDALDAFDLPL